MGIILSGPIKLETLANLITNSYSGFYRKRGWSTHDLRTNLELWTPSLINDRSINFENSDLNKTYQIARSMDGWIDKIDANEFAASIRAYQIIKCGWGNDETRTFPSADIVNLSLLEDLVTGQVIPSPLRKFHIDFLNCRNSYYSEEIIEYQKQLIAQAQERLNQSVSKAAYNIMNDLHP